MPDKRASPSKVAVRVFAALASLFVAIWSALWLWQTLDRDWCNRFRSKPEPVSTAAFDGKAPPTIDDHGGIDCRTIAY